MPAWFGSIATRVGVLIIILSLSGLSHANDGQLDPSFGTQGLLKTGYAVAPSTLYDSAVAVLVQSSGKLILVGNSATTTAAGSRIAITRRLSNGAVDTSFGIGGWSTISTGYTTWQATGAILLGDGGIVIVGTVSSFDGSSQMAVWRELPDGGPYTGWGGGTGLSVLTRTSSGTVTDMGRGLAVGGFGTGYILVVGSARDAVSGGSVGDDDFAAFLLDAATGVRLPFGNDVVNNMHRDGYNSCGGNPASDDTLNAAQYSYSEEEFVASGSSGVCLTGGGSSAVVLKFNTAGIDRSFGVGGSGYVSFNFGTSSSAFKNTALVWSGAGNIFVAGTVSDLSIGVAKLTSSGILDASFGSGAGTGIYFYPSSSKSVANAMVIEPSGKILVAGISGSGTASNFLMLRMSGTIGLADSTFGVSGWKVVSFLPLGEFGGPESKAYAINLSSSDAAVIAGSAYANAGGNDYAAARVFIRDYIFANGLD